MTPEAIDYLKKERPGEFHDRLCSYLVSLANQSRDEMKKHYPRWKATDASFKAKAQIDTANKEAVRAEKKAEERSEPGKFVLPIGHAQVDTFVSFGHQMFTQRDCVFELEPMGLEDEYAAKLAERSVEYDLVHSNFRGTVLGQYLTDAARYSFGVIKYSWVNETQVFQEAVPVETSGVDDIAKPTEMQDVPQVVFQGNKIVNTSVYRFLPDPRVPLYRFQEGEFCGDEDFVSYQKLKQLEIDGTIAGLEFVNKINQKSVESGRDFPFDPTNLSLMGKSVIDQPYILTELQAVITPSEFLADADEKDAPGRKLLGNSKSPVKFLFWVLNDNRVVKIERLNYPLDRFTWEVGVLSPDAENFLGLSLYDIIGSLQDVADWLINSRVTDIRKHIGLDLVVDESMLNTSDLKERRSIIRLAKSAQGTDVRRYIFQLSRNDTTQGNITDTQVIHQYAKEGTGLTDNLVGQFAGGRRSAREASQVYSNAANRIRTAMATLWFTGLEPLGRAILANQRAFLDVERIIKLLGVPNNPASSFAGVADYTGVTAPDLAGNFDFKIFDGTLPSDRAQQAATIQEFLTAGLQNPQIFVVAGLNPGLMLEDLFALRGIRNVSKYRLPPQQIVQMAQLFGLIGGQGAGPGGQGQGGPGTQQSNPQQRNSNGSTTSSRPSNGQVVAFPQR